MPAGQNVKLNPSTLDTSNPEMWVLSFDPRGDFGLSSTGKSHTVCNHREQIDGITVNLQAYRKNSDFQAS